MKKWIWTLVGMVLTIVVITSAKINAQVSKPEIWNNAAGLRQEQFSLPDGSSVSPNVYADEKKWARWVKEWKKVRDSFEQVALSPGTNTSELNYAWYSKKQGVPKVRLTKQDGKKINKTFVGTQNLEQKIVLNGVTYYPNRVTISGLAENSTYSYKYGFDGSWSKNYSYTVHDSSQFSVLFVGDPQIGASVGQLATTENDFENYKEYYARNDAYNWNETLTMAMKSHPKIQFILSTGDNVNERVNDSEDESACLEQQREFAGFLYPEVLRSLPMATAIGNHDNQTRNLDNHFYMPNSYQEEEDASIAGRDYYFTYGQTLFLVINTNNKNIETHETFMKDAIAQNQDCKFRVLMCHHDIYSSGCRPDSEERVELKTKFVPVIEDAKIDLVLEGHGHTYLLSKPMGKSGTIYLEANSSTGSKFYKLKEEKEAFVAVDNQNWRPTYTILNFGRDELQITTYDAATHEILKGENNRRATYTIVKR